MNRGLKLYQAAACLDPVHSEAKEREALILEYAPLVKKIVERMAIRLPASISKEELVSAGIMGLFDALDKFDAAKGIKFETYASLRVKGAILDELRKMDWVSNSVRRDMHKIENAMRALEIRLGRDPEDAEVAEELGLNVESYHHLLSRVSGAGLMSLDQVMPDGNTLRITRLASESDSPQDALARKELKSIVAQALKQLPLKEQMVMSLYYFDELTLKEIAQVLNLTESRISQIHSKVIIKLRTKLRAYYEE